MKAVRGQYPTDCFEHIRVVINNRDSLLGVHHQSSNRVLLPPFVQER
jgi:hypothetical protein